MASSIEKQAAQESKNGATRFVVYVFDQGAAVYTAEQCRRYAPLILIESAWIDGKCIATAEAAAALAS